MSGDTVAKYAAYDGTSDCIANPPALGQPCGSGTAATAYLAEVPFQDAAMTTDYEGGPTATSEVACMTCHRAHATSAQDARRWDFTVTGLAEDGADRVRMRSRIPTTSSSARSATSATRRTSSTAWWTSLHRRAGPSSSHRPGPLAPGLFHAGGVDSGMLMATALERARARRPGSR